MLIIDHDFLNTHQTSHNQSLHIGKKVIDSLGAVLCGKKGFQVAEQPFAAFISVIIRGMFLDGHISRVNI